MEPAYTTKDADQAQGAGRLRRCIFVDWPACPRRMKLPEDVHLASGCAASGEERLRCAMMFGRGRRIYSEFVAELERGFDEYLMEIKT